jgi:hypothetical protein
MHCSYCEKPSFAQTCYCVERIEPHDISKEKAQFNDPLRNTSDYTKSLLGIIATSRFVDSNWYLCSREKHILMSNFQILLFLSRCTCEVYNFQSRKIYFTVVQNFSGRTLCRKCHFLSATFFLIHSSDQVSLPYSSRLYTRRVLHEKFKV